MPNSNYSRIKEPVKEWPINERPREILLEKGPEYVSDAGLIAILLRTGIAGKDVVQFSRELLQQFGGLRGLLNASPEDLSKIKGLGPAKISQLTAALELAKRQLKEGLRGKDIIESEQDVLDYLSLSMRDLKKEFFKYIYLNKNNGIIEVQDGAGGTVDQSPIYPREVIKKALDLHAGGLIIVHNHPSGSLKPSRSDIDLTEKLSTACRSVSLTLLDHIIISPKGYLSLRSQGLI